ncbi:MAG: N-acetylneuraminate synthase family protein, partial [Gemmataceae bacterium]
MNRQVCSLPEETKMIVVMRQGASRLQVDDVISHIERLGLKSHVVVGTELTVVAAIGEKREGTRESLEILEGVDKVMPILAPYKVASLEVKKEPTVVQVRDLKVGGGHVGVIAGPCSVESRQQILETAELVKNHGATGLRGGAFKPRTIPYAFQGLKEQGLQYLAEARDATGLAVVTEVMAPETVKMVSTYADVLQIGARNMQNYALLEAVGNSGKPVLLKRGPSATMDEFLLAAEYILITGNTQVI